MDTKTVSRGLRCQIDDSPDCPDPECPYLGRLVCKQRRIMEDALQLVESRSWISVENKLPDCGQHVLTRCKVHMMNGNDHSYVCIAFHSEPHKIAHHYPEDDYCYDYDEERDEYYLKEGWYEVIHNWDEYSSVVIDDFVTHWMPLPEQPEEVS